jgi:hypothetical protein
MYAGQLQRMRDDELSKRASEPLPLAEYYDEVLLLPDLDKFEPAARCRAERNGEGDVLLADVSVDVPLHTTSLAGIQVGDSLRENGLVCSLLTATCIVLRNACLPVAAPDNVDQQANCWAANSSLMLTESDGVRVWLCAAGC